VASGTGGKIGGESAQRSPVYGTVSTVPKYVGKHTEKALLAAWHGYAPVRT